MYPIPVIRHRRLCGIHSRQTGAKAPGPVPDPPHKQKTRLISVMAFTFFCASQVVFYLCQMLCKIVPYLSQDYICYSFLIPNFVFCPDCFSISPAGQTTAGTSVFLFFGPSFLKKGRSQKMIAPVQTKEAMRAIRISFAGIFRPCLTSFPARRGRSGPRSSSDRTGCSRR